MAEATIMTGDSKANTPEGGKAIDITERVTATATAKAPHHSDGEEISAAPAVIELMKKNGWAK